MAGYSLPDDHGGTTDVGDEVPDDHGGDTDDGHGSGEYDGPGF